MASAVMDAIDLSTTVRPVIVKVSCKEVLATRQIAGLASRLS